MSVLKESVNQPRRRLDVGQARLEVDHPEIDTHGFKICNVQQPESSRCAPPPPMSSQIDPLEPQIDLLETKLRESLNGRHFGEASKIKAEIKKVFSQVRSCNSFPAVSVFLLQVAAEPVLCFIACFYY